jgi:superfamily I DNA/RNA helicase
MTPVVVRDWRPPGVRLATMHRVKGLEFDHVIIASVREGMVPPSVVEMESEDPVVKREAGARADAVVCRGDAGEAGCDGDAVWEEVGTRPVGKQLSHARRSTLDAPLRGGAGWKG